MDLNRGPSAYQPNASLHCQIYAIHNSDVKLLPFYECNAPQPKYEPRSQASYSQSGNYCHFSLKKSYDIVFTDFQGNIPKETPQSKFESETELKLENFILEGLWFRFGQNLTASPC